MGRKWGQRAVVRLEVPFTAEAPVLTSEEVGLTRLVRRPTASFELEVTILDAPDGRLMRDGVVVAHRVMGGFGQWYLAAPRWSPHLPELYTEPIESIAELPANIARRVRPFVRHSVIGPIAALLARRDEFALRNAQDETVAIVRDERVRVRRGGVITARYREVTIWPESELTVDQLRHLLLAATNINAVRVDKFPTLERRIGAPLTGLSNFPSPRKITPDDTLEDFVSSVFGHHLLAIVEADLDRRGHDYDDLSLVNDRLWAFGRDLRGLATVLEPAWRESVESLLVGLPFPTPVEIETATLGVLDALVGAVHAPRLGDLARKPAAQVLFQPAQQGAAILGERCRALSVDGSDQTWQAALRAAEQLEVAALVARPLYGKRLRKLVKLLDDMIDELRDCALGPFRGEPELEALTVRQAYQLGVDTERARGAVAARRTAFIDSWPKRAVKARKLMKKARKT